MFECAFPPTRDSCCWARSPPSRTRFKAIESSTCDFRLLEMTHRYSMLKATSCHTWDQTDGRWYHGQEERMFPWKCNEVCSSAPFRDLSHPDDQHHPTPFNSKYCPPPRDLLKERLVLSSLPPLLVVLVFGTALRLPYDQSTPNSSSTRDRNKGMSKRWYTEGNRLAAGPRRTVGSFGAVSCCIFFSPAQIVLVNPDRSTCAS